MHLPIKRIRFYIFRFNQNNKKKLHQKYTYTKISVHPSDVILTSYDLTAFQFTWQKKLFRIQLNFNVPWSQHWFKWFVLFFFICFSVLFNSTRHRNIYMYIDGTNGNVQNKNSSDVQQRWDETNIRNLQNRNNGYIAITICLFLMDAMEKCA